MDIRIFEIKEEHLLLINKFYIRWYYAEYGAPTIDPKRPYGSSSVESDIAEILGWKIDGEFTEEQSKEAEKIHKETETALQICLSRLKFETGIFENKGYGIGWEL